MRLTALFAAISLALVPIVPLGAASAQDDAGLGADAPNGSAGAVDLPFGAYSGALVYAEGDLEDWYRVVVPDGLAQPRMSVFASSGRLYAGLYTDAGGLVANLHVGPWDSVPAVVALSPGAYRVGLGDQAGQGMAEYALSFDAGGSDAGLGADAPNDAEAAVDLGLGAYSGALTSETGDVADWFRVAVPVERVLKVTFNLHASTDGGLEGSLHALAQGVESNGTSDGSPLILRAGPGGHLLRFAPALAGSSVTYAFTVEAVHDDAGLLDDAPDAREDAVELAYGAYAGLLASDEGDAADWYAVTIPEGLVFELAFHATRGNVTAEIQQGSSGGSPAWTATSSGEAFTTRATGGPFHVAFLNADGAGLASYAFTVAAVQNDMGTFADAPDEASAALAVAPDRLVFGGQLRPDEGDVEDWYRYALPCGGIRLVVHSWYGDGVDVGVYTTGGTLLASARSSVAPTVLESSLLGPFLVRASHGGGVDTADYHLNFTLEEIPPQDDAGRGCDAGDASSVAMDLAPGEYAGALPYDAGDKEDWYRIPAAPCSTVVVKFRATSGSLYGGLYTDSGAFITNVRSTGQLAALTSTKGTVRLGFGDQSGAGSAAYDFEVDVLPPPPGPCVGGS